MSGPLFCQKQVVKHELPLHVVMQFLCCAVAAAMVATVTNNAIASLSMVMPSRFETGIFSQMKHCGCITIVIQCQHEPLLY